MSIKKRKQKEKLKPKKVVKPTRPSRLLAHGTTIPVSRVASFGGSRKIIRKNQGARKNKKVVVGKLRQGEILVHNFAEPGTVRVVDISRLQIPRYRRRIGIFLGATLLVIIIAGIAGSFYLTTIRENIIGSDTQKTLQQTIQEAGMGVDADSGRTLTPEERLKRYVEATTILEKSAVSAEDLATLASLYQNVGNLTKAVETWGQVVAKEPSVAIYHNNFANVLSSQEKYEAAEKQYREAIRLDAKLVAAYYGLATMLHSQKDIAGAKLVLKDGLAQNPQDPFLQSLLDQYNNPIKLVPVK